MNKGGHKAAFHYMFIYCVPRPVLQLLGLTSLEVFLYVHLTGYSTVKTKDRGITETAPQLVVKGVG